MMKFGEFVKKELQGWKSYEIVSLVIVLSAILYNTFVLKDNIVAVISAICGILYTIIAGKGKISCYFFGLMGSGCYSWLAFCGNLWGNLVLYLFYYIPMQTLGIFRWKKHLKSDTFEIEKKRLYNSERLKLLFIAVVGCVISVLILKYLKDSSPITDGITTFLSIIGMYLTVKRYIEQWIVWMFVNGISFFMWLNLILNGAKAYSTLVMWGMYFILAIYFYFVWQKEIKSHHTI